MCSSDLRGIPHAGGGIDIDHARAPGYVDSARGRVAFMSAASTFLGISRAGPGRADFPGRPGISTLRRNVVHHVPREAFDQLVRTNRELGFEAIQDAQARFGFVVGTISRGQLWMQNNAGVILHLQARRRGLMLSTGADAVEIGRAHV